MNIAMVIPTYWGREGGVFVEGDEIYDHPTPLGDEGTLQRAIESISTLEDHDFELIILGCATAKDIRDDMEEKVDCILKKTKSPVKVSFFSHSDLVKLRKKVLDFNKEGYKRFLDLEGYSNIRNMCTVIPHLMNKDVAILIDDDELFSKPDFIEIIKDDLDKVIEGKQVEGVAGFYTKDGEWKNKLKSYPWREHWNKALWMNEALTKLVGDTSEKRLVPSFYALGGNLTITKSLFMDIPFDPLVSRGEDMDFLINAMMFGRIVYFDNHLSIEHHPPPSTQPAWLVLRRDITRFIYEHRKLKHQKEIEGMRKVQTSELCDYPGKCLHDDCVTMLTKANNALIDYYDDHDDKKGKAEAEKNIILITSMLDKDDDPFLEYVQLQKQWKEMMHFFEDNRDSFKLELRTY